MKKILVIDRHSAGYFKDALDFLDRCAGKNFLGFAFGLVEIH